MSALYVIEVEVVKVFEGFMATPKIQTASLKLKLPYSISRSEERAVSYALAEAAVAFSTGKVK